MTTLLGAIKTLLAADATLITIITGGVYVKDDLGPQGLTPDNVQRESDGVRIKPTLVIVAGVDAGTEITVTEPSERTFLNLWFYAPTYDAIERAQRRCKDLLHRKFLGPTTTDKRGLNFIHYVDRIPPFNAEELENWPAGRSRYYIDSTRQT